MPYLTLCLSGEELREKFFGIGGSFGVGTVPQTCDCRYRILRLSVSNGLDGAGLVKLQVRPKSLKAEPMSLP